MNLLHRFHLNVTTLCTIHRKQCSLKGKGKGNINSASLQVEGNTWAQELQERPEAQRGCPRPWDVWSLETLCFPTLVSYVSGHTTPQRITSGLLFLRASKTDGSSQSASLAPASPAICWGWWHGGGRREMDAAGEGRGV